MGKTALNVDGVKALATLPSLDELRAKIVGLIQAPATKIAQLVNAPAAKLARVFRPMPRRTKRPEAVASNQSTGSNRIKELKWLILQKSSTTSRA